MLQLSSLLKKIEVISCGNEGMFYVESELFLSYVVNRNPSCRNIIFIINQREYIKVADMIAASRKSGGGALFMAHYILYKHKLFFTTFDTKYLLNPLGWHCVHCRGGFKDSFRTSRDVMLNVSHVIRWYTRKSLGFFFSSKNENMKKGNFKYRLDHGRSLGRYTFFWGDQRTQSQQSSLHHVYQLSHKIQKLIRIMFWKIFCL